jgi:hypothetical protein
MLAELDKRAQENFTYFITCLDANLGENQYIVFEGRRSVRVQEAYYVQGRKPLAEVNDLRKIAGLYLLRSEKDNYIITWTLKSKHIEGLAMDVLPVDGAGNPTWDLAHYRDAFEKIRFCGRGAGLVCGADWPSPQTDWPHYEIRG